MFVLPHTLCSQDTVAYREHQSSKQITALPPNIYLSYTFNNSLSKDSVSRNKQLQKPKGSGVSLKSHHSPIFCLSPKPLSGM